MKESKKMEWITLYDSLYPLFVDADPEDLYEWKDNECPDEAAASDFTAMMLEPINSHMREVADFYVVSEETVTNHPNSHSLFGMPACHIQSYTVEKAEMDTGGYFDEVLELWIRLDGTMAMVRCWQLTKGDFSVVARKVEHEVESREDICRESLDDLMYDFEDFVQMLEYCENSVDPYEIEHP